jgi:hypothetical protein
MVNNDIIPAIPTCELPKGATAEDWGLIGDGKGNMIPRDYAQYIDAVQKEEAFMPDANKVMETVLKDSLNKMELAPGTDVNALVAKVMKEQAGTVKDLNLTSEDGQNELKFLIKGMNSVVEEHFTSEKVPRKAVDEVVIKVEDDLNNQGFDSSKFDLKDIAA